MYIYTHIYVYTYTYNVDTNYKKPSVTILISDKRDDQKKTYCKGNKDIFLNDKRFNFFEYFEKK